LRNMTNVTNVTSERLPFRHARGSIEYSDGRIENRWARAMVESLRGATMDHAICQLLMRRFGIESEEEMERILSDPETMLAILDVADASAQRPHVIITTGVSE